MCFLIVLCTYVCLYGYLFIIMVKHHLAVNGLLKGTLGKYDIFVSARSFVYMFVLTNVCVCVCVYLPLFIVIFSFLPVTIY